MSAQSSENSSAPIYDARAIWIDRFVRVALGLFFAFSAGIYVQNAFEHIHKLSDGFSLAVFSKALAVFAGGIYSLTVASLYVVRLRPVNKFAGWWASFSALLGGFLGMGLILFPPDDNLSTPLQLLSSFMILLGNGLTAYILTHLGRSFSILPESRRLVVEGPYRYVRHPLYVVEAVATVGALINFWSLGALALVLAQFAFQFVRMHYEERVMTETFPEYADYARRTARLVPGLY